MEISEANRESLRRRLDDRIPAGGSDTNCILDNVDIDTLLGDAKNIDAAAAEGWMMIASRLKASHKREQYKVGDESYKFTSLKDALDHAKEMAAFYKDKAKSKSRVVSLTSNVSSSIGVSA